MRSSWVKEGLTKLLTALFTADDYMLHGCTVSKPAVTTGSLDPWRVLKLWTLTAVQKMLIQEVRGIINCDSFLE